jgi:hypothetical protein
MSRIGCVPCRPRHSRHNIKNQMTERILSHTAVDDNRAFDPDCGSLPKDATRGDGLCLAQRTARWGPPRRTGGLPRRPPAHPVRMRAAGTGAEHPGAAQSAGGERDRQTFRGNRPAGRLPRLFPLPLGGGEDQLDPRQPGQPGFTIPRSPRYVNPGFSVRRHAPGDGRRTGAPGRGVGASEDATEGGRPG